MRAEGSYMWVRLSNMGLAHIVVEYLGTREIYVSDVDTMSRTVDLVR